MCYGILWEKSKVHGGVTKSFKKYAKIVSTSRCGANCLLAGKVYHLKHTLLTKGISKNERQIRISSVTIDILVMVRHHTAGQSCVSSR